MNYRDLKIGYFPNSPFLTAPADRRRFVFYAKRRGLEFEIANPAVKYDIVVLNQRADLSVWSNYRHGRSKIIYDASDSYINARDYTWKSLLRGTSKFITRQSKYPQLSYRVAVQKMCSHADAVICSTEEQRAEILRLNPNVHLVLDIQEDDILAHKSDYRAGDTFNLVWEGLSSSGIPIEMMREILGVAAHGRRVALHCITDLVYYRYLNEFVRRHTTDDVTVGFGDLAAQVHLYQWTPFALSHIAAGADLAIIPVDLTNSFNRGKPENKLLLFWRMGIPTITSATPAYVRAMDLAGLEMTCSSKDEWENKLAEYMADEMKRALAGRQGLSVSQTYYSAEQMLDKWDLVFKSLLQ